MSNIAQLASKKYLEDMGVKIYTETFVKNLEKTKQLLIYLSYISKVILPGLHGYLFT